MYRQESYEHRLWRLVTSVEWFLENQSVLKLGHGWRGCWCSLVLHGRFVARIWRTLQVCGKAPGIHSYRSATVAGRGNAPAPWDVELKAINARLGGEIKGAAI